MADIDEKKAAKSAKKAAKREREQVDDAPAAGAAAAAPASAKRPRVAAEEPAAEDDAAGAEGAGAVAYVAPIASPLAGKKLAKKTLKVVKKAAGSKVLRRGVKEVVKALRKGEKGLIVLAADISPIDVLSHIPVLCEDSAVPYIFVSGKAELGAAAGTKRPTSVVLVATKTAKGEKTAAADIEKWSEVLEEVTALQPRQ